MLEVSSSELSQSGNSIYFRASIRRDPYLRSWVAVRLWKRYVFSTFSKFFGFLVMNSIQIRSYDWKQHILERFVGCKEDQQLNRNFKIISVTTAIAFSGQLTFFSPPSQGAPPAKRQRGRPGRRGLGHLLPRARGPRPRFARGLRGHVLARRRQQSMVRQEFLVDRRRERRDGVKLRARLGWRWVFAFTHSLLGRSWRFAS